MLEFLPSANDVIAVRVSHKIRGADLDSIMDRLESLLNRFDKIHVFVETQVIDGIELSGLPTYIARAMPLFTKLNRFGRVAVVADQAWVRLGTRLESLILPFISYRVFEPEERDEAFTWVNGKGDPS
ncbi:MAG TPA: STAS/SEC14 domain-containing protein [Allosphingosinicella sp.]|nr:STAS/SEC14 domain-containing protein [Allosphingosinicella sp.]